MDRLAQLVVVPVVQVGFEVVDEFTRALAAQAVSAARVKDDEAALVLFAHGSRDPEWAAPFRKVQERVAAKSPELEVELAFLEFMNRRCRRWRMRSPPRIADASTIAPRFMAQGAHLKRAPGSTDG